jgi:hypothetical protein
MSSCQNLLLDAVNQAALVHTAPSFEVDFKRRSVLCGLNALNKALTER